ncbi:uncharacterized protein ARMOST_03239 [Armillaria ostoyae]|uniref:DUF4939 domain-containing protein n=1 Tax=Armillaria ostoyae TaxID=47428 RepID=A0A284QTX7_ARMOS|nr:uncharacterized protein ARMOST_03239 [Armillaria ostoyae]
MAKLQKPEAWEEQLAMNHQLTSAGNPMPVQSGETLLSLSLLGGLPKWDNGTPLLQPSGTMANDAPWTGCWPELIRKPEVFKGDSDDIEQFITTCKVYFQVHSTHMFPDLYKVAFGQSYFKGKALDWWMLQLAELKSNSRGKY